MIVVPKDKVAITVDRELLAELDELIAARTFPNRSRAIEIALAEKLERLSGSRLTRECAKFDPREEQSLADLGLAADLKEWPEY
jgi:Arc/MetJ-type ribon-helix-helix transcriptional regulator